MEAICEVYFAFANLPGRPTAHGKGLDIPMTSAPWRAIARVGIPQTREPCIVRFSNCAVYERPRMSRTEYLLSQLEGQGYAPPLFKPA